MAVGSPRVMQKLCCCRTSGFQRYFLMIDWQASQLRPMTESTDNTSWLDAGGLLLNLVELQKKFNHVG